MPCRSDRGRALFQIETYCCAIPFRPSGYTLNKIWSWLSHHITSVITSSGAADVQQHIRSTEHNRNMLYFSVFGRGAVPSIPRGRGRVYCKCFVFIAYLNTPSLELEYKHCARSPLYVTQIGKIPDCFFNTCLKSCIVKIQDICRLSCSWNTQHFMHSMAMYF